MKVGIGQSRAHSITRDRDCSEPGLSNRDLAWALLRGETNLIGSAARSEGLVPELRWNAIL